MKKRLMLSACSLFVVIMLVMLRVSLAIGPKFTPEEGQKRCLTSNEGRKICSNYCADFTLESIPVGNFKK
jgi:hypothetical protein